MKICARRQKRTVEGSSDAQCKPGAYSVAVRLKRVRAETIDALSQLRAQPRRRSILG